MGEKKVDEGLFTAKELESLEKKIVDVEKWRDDKLEEQEKMVLSEMPKLTVSSIKSKIQDLDGEVQLLIGKARMIRAERERAKRKAEEEKKKEEEKAKKEKKEKEANSEKEEDKEEATTEPPVENDGDKPNDSSEEKPEPTVTTDDSDGAEDVETPSEETEQEHTEL